MIAADLNIVKVDGWKLALLSEQDERRVRDEDLGEKLGFKPPRKIRQLIKRHLPRLKKLGEIQMRNTVVRIEKRGAITGFEDREIAEYWLTRDQALFITSQSGMEIAGDITVALIQAYNKLRAHVAELEARLSRGEAFYNRMLLETRRPWQKTWSEEIPKALAKLYGWDLSCIRGYPSWMGNISGRIYNLVVGTETMNEARRRRDDAGGHTHGNELHTWFKEDTRDFFVKKLDTVLALIRTSDDVSDYWDRMEREYGMAMLQMQLDFEQDGCCRRCGIPLVEGARFCQQCGSRIAA